MQDEISIKPLVDILSEQLGEQVVISGDSYVMIKDKSVVDVAKVNTALTIQSKYYVDNIQATKKQELRISYETANQADIDYMNTTFQADKYSQNLIVSVLSAGSVPSGFVWFDKSNTGIAMTYEQLQGLSGVILARGQTNFMKLQGLKTKVKSAATQGELDAIVW